MFQRLGGLVSFVAVLLCIGAAVLWARSRNHADLLLISAVHGQACGAGSAKTGIMFAWTDIRYDGYFTPGSGGWRVATFSSSRDEFQPIQDALFDPDTTVKFSFLGLKTAKGAASFPANDQAHYAAIIVPYWLILLATAVIALRGGRTLWIRRRRRRKGWCLACGYDIRASAGRCPECGKEIPERKSPAGFPVARTAS